MNLWELSKMAARRAPSSVPEWTLGCFRRRSITFFDGSVDTTTEVIWLQTRGLTADFRLPPARPALREREELFACDADALGLLLDAEAGVSHTKWDAGLMSWHDWIGFQTRVKWPEPGVLRRVGDCLVEFAPSGAYVEDWRFEPPGKGPLVGLELIDERDSRDGSILHEGGALIVCGRHAAFVRGRPHAAEPNATGMSRRQAPNRSALEAWFACEASYAAVGAGANARPSDTNVGASDVALGSSDVADRASDTGVGEITIVASTSPWREGKALLSMEGFDYDESSEQVIQRAVEEGRPIERRFTIDTLEPSFEPVRDTPVTADGRSWREAESATLLRYAQPARWR